METQAIRTETKAWSDETMGSSTIDGLSFDGDKNWTSGEVKIKGLCRKQAVQIIIQVDGEEVHSSKSTVEDNQEHNIPFQVNGRKEVNVYGKIVNRFATKAGAKVSVELNYELD